MNSPRKSTSHKVKITLSLLPVLLFGMAVVLEAQFVATDPGVRKGSDAGGPIADLSGSDTALFTAGQDQFQEVQSVQGEEPGLGPRFNLDSCAGCHSQPATGGSSPFVNPQVEVATKADAINTVPFFITIDGPVREARFKFKTNGTRDGGVHNLYTIAGRTDASGCKLSQPNFGFARAQNNLIFRIPTPVFGAGLIEAIPDATIIENKHSSHFLKQVLGISGRENRSGNDGTITRFGWKAQNKSLEIFAGEAYNVEQGVTNQLFPQERDETPSCLFNATPENLDDVTKFANFMRFLAPPTLAPDTPSIKWGRDLFEWIGCALCHTPSLKTGASSSAALSYKEARLSSDLLLHNMGPRLADDIKQGNAGPDEFRTAPLWGLGQRIFFLHDGRTTDLLEAIRAHKSYGNFEFRSSEANVVIDIFNALSPGEKQAILDFLRSL